MTNRDKNKIKEIAEQESCLYETKDGKFKSSNMEIYSALVRFCEYKDEQLKKCCTYCKDEKCGFMEMDNTHCWEI